MKPSSQRYLPKRREFYRIIEGLEQNLKLPEVATKAPPVGGQCLANLTISWCRELTDQIQPLIFKRHLIAGQQIFDILGHGQTFTHLGVQIRFQL